MTSSLALLQLKVSVDDSWLDYFIIGVYFLFVLGGLSSSIYNEVLQFFLITLGISPLVSSRWWQRGAGRGSRNR